MLEYGNALRVLPFGSSSQKVLLSNATVVSTSCFFVPTWTVCIALEKTSVNEAGCSGHTGLGSVGRGAGGRSLGGAALAGAGGVAAADVVARSVRAGVAGGGVAGDATAGAGAAGREVVDGTAGAVDT